MQEQITVSVQQEDIDNGKPEDCDSCPIALACRRLGYKDVSVGVSLHVDDHDYWLPSEASRFIEEFDNGEVVSPFSFTANLSDNNEPDMSAEAE